MIFGHDAIVEEVAEEAALVLFFEAFSTRATSLRNLAIDLNPAMQVEIRDVLFNTLLLYLLIYILSPSVK